VAASDVNATKSVLVVNYMEVPVEKKKPNLEIRQRRMKCWGTLFAHMSGFAAINAGGTMQHLEIFSNSWYMSLVPVVLCQLFIMSMFFCFGQIRGQILAEAMKAGRAGMRAAMFDEEVMDSENDILCLAGSYQLVSSLRFAMVGVQPNMVGEIEGGSPWQCVYGLYIAGLIMTALSVAIILLRPKLVVEEEDKEGAPYRGATVLAGMLGMGFAWCTLFASRSVFENESERLEVYHIGMETIMGRVLLALSLSVVSMLVIFGLDVVGDFFKARSPPGQDTGSDIIQQIVGAKSILVGFSWENAFDGGVEAIASLSSSPLIAESVLAASVFLVVVPAWRRHILTKAMTLQNYFSIQAGFEAADADKEGFEALPLSSP